MAQLSTIAMIESLLKLLLFENTGSSFAVANIDVHTAI